VLFLALYAHAATIVVDAGGGGDATTVMAGLALAATGDIVEVRPGTYAEDVDFQARTVLLTGDGSSTTILQGTGNGPVVRIDSGEGEGTGLVGFTIQGGDATDYPDTGNAGGGLHSRGVPLYAEDLVFLDNLAEYGGGALVGEAEGVMIAGSVFAGNQARAGGALYLLSGTIDLQELSVDGNLALNDGDDGVGGGVVLYDTVATVRDLSMLGNEATDVGGGLYLAGTTQLTCTRCAIAEGSSARGGGVYASGATAEFEGSSVTDSRATSGGGGIYASSGAVLIGRGLTLDANDAPYGGGLLLSDSSAELLLPVVSRNTADSGAGIYVDEAQLEVSNGLFSSNQADIGNGGAIALDTSTATVLATVFADNYGYSGAALYVNAGSIATVRHATMVEGASPGSASGVRVADGGFLSLDSSIVAYGSDGSGVSAGAAATALIRYSNFWANTDGNTSSGLADPVGSDGNLGENPLFVAFAADGEPTDDLHLSSGSPCIDAADPAETDPDGGPSDMGAYGGPDAAGWDVSDGDLDGWTTDAGDCNDADASVYPGAEDGCDDIDQDCDGTAREGCDTGTPTDDTGTVETDDTGATQPADDTGPLTGDSADGGKDGGDGCGCATGGSGAAFGVLGAIAALIGRRRR